MPIPFYIGREIHFIYSEKTYIQHILTKGCRVFSEDACKGDANVRHAVSVKRQQRRQKFVGKVLLTFTSVTCRQDTVAE